MAMTSCRIGLSLERRVSMRNYKISVIVPVYNVEKYLEECIYSILKQDYQDFELLIIDDGSTDSSTLICDSYQNFANVKVFHKNNGGLSDARNYGIKKASGQYVCFIDSDDKVTSDYLSSMMKNIEQYNTKIAACGIARFSDNKINKYNFENIQKKYNLEDALIHMNVCGYFNVSVCNKLFARQLFDEIKFPVNKQSEDWFVIYKLIEKSGDLYYDSTVKYLYRERQNSITRSEKPNTDAIEAAREIYDHYSNNKKIIRYAGQAYILAIIGVYNKYLRQKKSESCQKTRKLVIGQPIRFTYKKVSIFRKVQLFLFMHSINIYNYAIKKWLHF